MNKHNFLLSYTKISDKSIYCDCISYAYDYVKTTKQHVKIFQDPYQEWIGFQSNDLAWITINSIQPLSEIILDLTLLNIDILNYINKQLAVWL
jgi:hypothetical protein